MKKAKKISEKEKKLRTFLREEQARLRKITKDIEKNPDKWKFNKDEDLGKKTVEINKRIDEKKAELKKYGYKGKKEKTVKVEKGTQISFYQNLGFAWDKKSALDVIFNLARPDMLGGYWLETQLEMVNKYINGIYSKLDSRHTVDFTVDSANRGWLEVVIGKRKQRGKTEGQND